MKQTKKVVFIILLSLTGICLLLFLSVWIFSGNTPEGKTKIAGKGWTEIGGIRQGYFIRGENEENPVLLFLHGGPGSPELPMIKNTELEKYFTICYWDQRGAGMSYNSDTKPGTMTVAQMVEDARAMTDILRQRYRQDKIYLMGHSWGSYLGIKTIEKYPGLYKAYIGIGQVTHQRESERMAYDYIIGEAQKAGDQKTVKAFTKYDKYAPEFPSNDYLLKVRTQGMNKYGVGIMHKNASMFHIALDLMYYRGYTLGDKLNYLQGTMFSLQNLFHCVLEDNLFESSIHFEVPVYIVHGKYDYQVSYVLSRAWFNTITAPGKAFFTFENSAHSPNIEEVEKFVGTVRSMQKGYK